MAAVFVTACSSDSDSGNQPSGDTGSDAATVQPPANAADKLADELKTRMDEFRASYSALKTDEEKQAARQSMPDPEEYLERFTMLAEEEPGSPTSVSALVWLAVNARDKEDVQAAALDTLFEEHLDSPKLKDVALSFRSARPSAQVQERLQMLIDQSPHDGVRAAATYVQAAYLQQVQQLREMKDPEMIDRIAEVYGQELVDYIQQLEIPEGRIEELYQSVADNYSDELIKSGDSERNLGELASAALNEIRNLRVGCIAPEITADDLDGVEFSLSDYRGKVVMLDFWGHW